MGGDLLFYTNKKHERLGEEKLNSQGCLMKIVEYNDSSDVMVEFQDKYKTIVHTEYNNFNNGVVKNPYYTSVFGVGMIGVKYPTSSNGKNIKEYRAWFNMLKRCYVDEFKQEHITYKDILCCEEWLNYENFYEWLHSQENFEQWLNGERWEIDKDILTKGNKIYSPETCCLVPHNVNSLFVKTNKLRGTLPIGVIEQNGKFASYCKNYLIGKRYHKYLGVFNTSEEAFYAYKKYKEDLIKQVAKIEYNAGNITKQCYDAIMKYEVEITD